MTTLWTADVVVTRIRQRRPGYGIGDDDMGGCSCGSATKDQSPKEVAEYLNSEHKAGRLRGEPNGVGVFLVPNPARGPLRYSTVLVHGITYHDASLRALACPAYKWFPYGMSLEVDEGSVTIEENQDFGKILCRAGPCSEGQWCGDPRTCFCSGNTFGIQHCVEESDD